MKRANVLLISRRMSVRGPVFLFGRRRFSRLVAAVLPPQRNESLPPREKLQALQEDLRGRMFEDGVGPHRSNMLVSLKRGQTDDATAIAIVGHMVHEGLAFHHKHFAIMMSGLGKRGLWRTSCSLLGEMRARKLEPNTICYNVAINACQRGSSWTSALQVFNEMSQIGAIPDVITYSTLISACDKGAQWRDALAILAKGIQSSMRPDQRCFTAVVGACAHGHRWAHALSILDEIRVSRVRPDLICCNSILSACARGSEWAHAVSLLEAMQLHGPSPDVFSYNTVSTAFDDGLQWEFAIDSLRQLERLQVQPDVVSFNAAIKACRHPDVPWAAALDLLEELSSSCLQPSVSSYGSLLAVLSAHKQWQLALCALEDMQCSWLTIDSGAYASAVQVCASTGQVSLALELYRDAFACGALTHESRSEPGVVILHDHCLEVSLTAVHAVLLDVLCTSTATGEETRRNPRQDLIVLTGRGSHNSSGHSRVASALAQFLSEEFSPPLDLVPFVKDTRRNPGRWVIPAESLQRWIEESSAIPVEA